MSSQRDQVLVRNVKDSVEIQDIKQRKEVLEFQAIIYAANWGSGSNRVMY